ncbi:MAG: BatA and WFA domain-containing protein [Bacteroidales bacterium]|nr:BatA and WFA domain-containing protein [Bacteroidales bacterium]
MTFASPLFLLGLLAVAIPIVVHLFNFRRYRKVYFSNVDKLEQLQTETRRQSTLRQLLIMVARILAIVFLVLAFARPVLSRGDADVRTGANDVSIFIDNSFSMENSDGSGMLLDKAKTKAREIVAAYAPGDRFQLLTCDVEGRHFHWLSKEEMLSAIDEVQISGSTAMLHDIARRQVDFLHGGSGINRYAYLVSDFQASTVAMDAMPTDTTVTLTLVPLAATVQGNVYVDSVALGVPAVHRAGSTSLTVWLGNEGDVDLDKVPVALYVGDRQRALATVDLAARSSSAVELHFTVDESGVLDCRVETEDYPVTFDNVYYFSLNVRDRVDCLIVEGNGRNPFLASLFEGDSSVRCTTMPLRQMDFTALDGHDMVLLDELPSISSGMAQTLHSFVQQGGTLVVVAAADADYASYNAALALFDAPQLGGKHEGKVTASFVDMGNALYLNVFNGKKGVEANMELPTVGGYHRLLSTSSTLREPLITLAGGDDYICHTPHGEGHLYIISAPLSDSHTDFVRQALFVPTLYNMALYSVTPSALASTIGSSQTLPLASKYDVEGHAVRMRKRDADEVQEIIPDVRSGVGGSRLVTANMNTDAGNYHILRDGEVSEGVSFNYSRDESKMTFLGVDALQRTANDYGLNNVSVVPNPDKPLDVFLRERMDGRSLWRWCLIFSLLMLLTEIILIKVKTK